VKKVFLKSIVAVILITFLLTIASCAGVGDFAFEVGTGYELWRSSAHVVRVQPIEENRLSRGGEMPRIEAKVVEIAWDERYVLAKRFNLINHPENPNRPEIPDETKAYYYILDTIDLILYGAFDLEGFEQKRQELGISDDLILQPVHPNMGN